MELHVKTSYLLQTNQCNGMKSSDINSQWTVRKINPVLSIILIFPMNSSNTASRLSLIIVNKKFTFSGESFTRANKKGFSHVCIGVCRGKCWLFSSDFVYPAGRRTKNQLSPGLFRYVLTLSLTSHVDVVGEDGLLEGADLAGVLPTVHTLRQTDDQLATVLQLHNLPPDTQNILS